MAYESRLSLTVDSRTGERRLKSFRGELDKTERTGTRAMGNIKNLVVGLSGALAGLGVTRYFKGIIKDSQEFESRMLSINAIIEANGQAAGVTADQLRDQARELAFSTLQSTRGVLDAQKVLLSFRKVSGDTFSEAIELSTDLSSVFGVDLSRSARVLGRALDEPAENLTALRRFGIQFSDSQKEMIRGMSETNRLAEAQDIVLGKIRDKIGGAAEGEAGGVAGQFDTLGQNIEEFGLSVSEALEDSGAFTTFIETLSRGVSRLNEKFFSDEREALELFNRQIEIQEELNQLREKGYKKYGRDANTVRRLERELVEVQERRRELLSENEKRIRDEAEAERQGEETQAEIREQARQDRLDAERAMQAKLLQQREEARAEAVGSIIEQSQNELLALQLSDRAMLQHQLSVAGATEQERALAVATFDATEKLKAQNQAAVDAASALKSLKREGKALVDELDPLGAGFEDLGRQQQLLIDYAAATGMSDERRDALITQLVETFAEAGEESAEAFINPWQSAADTVAQSLQDAIASGDWDDIGDAIGGALGSSIAAVVNKQVTDSLAKNITADSGMFAQIGAAFAGPIAGAVAGGVAQLAIAEVSDWLSSSDWDPTEARQAAQGTRTILGDMDAKSESIRRAVEGSESGIGQLVGINQNMLRSLQGLLAGISGASTMVARGYGGLSMPTDFNRTVSDSDFNLTGGIMPIFDETLGMAFDFFDEMSSIFTFGMFDLGGALRSVFGGSRKVKDLGIQFFGATLDEMIRGWRDSDRRYTAQAYASIEEDGGWFGSDKRWDEFQRLGPEAENQISLVFSGIRDSVVAGAEALGMTDGEIDRALSRFRVATQKISLENLSADEQAEELEAVFSSIFDNLAGSVVPYIDDFQQAGEGLGETLARVANQTLVTQEAVNRLGIQFSDLAGRELVVASERLMDAAGGVEQFITSMQGFIGNFASDAQKFELAHSDMTRALEQSNLQLPETRDGYYDLLQAQNGATAAGAENIATLLRLQGVADQYYTFLEDAQKSAVDTQVELLQIQRSAISESLREAERASDSVSRALAGLTIQSSSFARLSRDAALASLQSMAASGRIGDQGQLDRALSAATNIQAGEFSTMNDYIREVARTGAVLTDVKQVADKRVSAEQRALNAIEATLKAMQEESKMMQSGIAKNTAKTAKILERMEIEGVAV